MTVPAEYWSDDSLSLGDCFERAAAVHGSRPALVSEQWSASYRELDAVTNRVANGIRVRGSSPGDRVAVLMPHDTPAIAAIVAVAKAGCILVYLNPVHPPARLRALFEDSEPSLVICDRDLRPLAQAVAADRCAVVEFEPLGAAQPHDAPRIVVPAAEPAVLAYTSGSTGQPKAVMMTHRQLLRNAAIRTESMECSETDRLPLLGAMSGGQAISLIWSSLLVGAALYPFALSVRGVTGLADWMFRYDINAFMSSASIFRNFIKTLDPAVRFTGVRAVRLSSEPATSDDFKLFQQHFPRDCVFVHTLSSSETCNIAWSRRGRDHVVPPGRLPVGLVSWGQRVDLVGDDGEPVPAGEVGEIVVTSRHVAAGYWRNPALTAERFSDVLDADGTRRVRTGDLGRINGLGQLEHQGRKDDRVKIRGNRIELGEVEEAIRRIEGVEACSVAAIPRSGLEPLLVGFVSLHENASWSATDLRRALRLILPGHMVPSDFVFLPRLPLTTTGKVDREHLRQSYRAKDEGAGRSLAGTATEAILAHIWAVELEVEGVGPKDDFFALGGDSLIATVIAARVHGELGVAVDLATIVDHPILSDLARVIDQKRSASTPEAVPLAAVNRSGPLPLSFIQERIWWVSRTPAESLNFTVTRVFNFTGPLDLELFERCVNEMVQRHEILRTAFVMGQSGPVQVVRRPMKMPLRYRDVSLAPDPEAAAIAEFAMEGNWSFDVASPPLLRFTLVRIREHDYRLMRVAHHIVCDNASWSVYFRELGQLYAAMLEKQPISNPPALQFGDYAVWERRSLSGPTFQKKLKWWTGQLAGARALPNLPIDPPPDPAGAVPADGVTGVEFDAHASARLNALSAASRSTRPVLRLAAFATLLASETGQNDVLVGMYMTARQRLPLWNMMGDFANLVPMRLRVDMKASFSDWLSAVRRAVLATEANSEIPYDMLCAELARLGGAMPTINAIFHVPITGRMIEFSGIKLGWSDRLPARMPWGFTLAYDEADRRSELRAHFDPRIYHPPAVRNFLRTLKRFLEAAAIDPDRSLGDLVAMARSDAPHEAHARQGAPAG